MQGRVPARRREVRAIPSGSAGCTASATKNWTVRFGNGYCAHARCGPDQNVAGGGAPMVCGPNAVVGTGKRPTHHARVIAPGAGSSGGVCMRRIWGAVLPARHRVWTPAAAAAPRTFSPTMIATGQRGSVVVEQRPQGIARQVGRLQGETMGNDRGRTACEAPGTRGWHHAGDCSITDIVALTDVDTTSCARAVSAREGIEREQD